MGKSYTPQNAESWLAPDASERAKKYMTLGMAAGKAKLPYNLDNWGGYPAARSRFLTTAQSAAANLIVVSGDSHNAWANDLIEGGKPAGVEFGGHSVSSPGFESFTKVDPKTVARDLIEASPELRWADTSNRGYMVLNLTPVMATNEYIFIGKGPSSVLGTKKLSVRLGRKTLEGV